MASQRAGNGGLARTGPSLAPFPELATYVSRTPGRPVIRRLKPRTPSHAMRAATSARILRSTVLVILIGGSVAAALAFGAWHLLPYEALEADTFAGRFAIWEGAMWGLGLAGALFGVAAMLNATDLYSARPLEQVQQQIREARRQGRGLYSDLPAAPWVVLVIGVALILAAVFARATMLG